jgi:hypothetical protein
MEPRFGEGWLRPGAAEEGEKEWSLVMVFRREGGADPGAGTGPVKRFIGLQNKVTCTLHPNAEMKVCNILGVAVRSSRALSGPSQHNIQRAPLS